MKAIFLKNKIRLYSSPGFTLVETLVAISIFSLSILGLISVLSQGIANINYAKQRMVAEYLAQEGVEYVRNVRDNYVIYNPTSGQTGWNNFNLFSCTAESPCGYNTASYPGYLCSDAGRTCKLYINNGSYDSDPANGIDSGFTRTILFTTINANERRISVNVSWTQGSGIKTVTLSEDVFNWIE
jgi:type II secretory pathway pseudopilin PulG